MNTMHKIGDFILSAWIWQFTADWFHPIVTGIVMFFLLRIIMRRSRLRALAISFIAQILALTLLTMIALGILVHLLGWEFEPVNPYEAVKRITFFMPTINLGIIYAILQSCIFIVFSFFWNINIVGFLIVSWLSNGIGAMISYMFIQMAEIMKYV